MTIRQEKPPDYESVYALVKGAFATAPFSDGSEADYLNAVRKKDTFIPELSFVAEAHDGMLVGQIVLYRAFITTGSGPHETLVLSPISVHPDHFKKGIARMLIDHALKQAFKLGHTSVFLCGDPALYGKFGFRPSFSFGIYHKDDPHAPWCMGRELCDGALRKITGTIDIV